LALGRSCTRLDDTVAPGRVVAPNSIDTDMVGGQVLLGCRVPTIVVSPFSVGNPAAPTINSGLYDHTSVLKLIEWRYGLPTLTARDASSGEIGNLVNTLNFGLSKTAAPPLPIITPPIPTPCGLFELGSEIDNESYDFFKLLISDLVSDWRAAGKSIPAPPATNLLNTIATDITSIF